MTSDNDELLAARKKKKEKREAGGLLQGKDFKDLDSYEGGEKEESELKEEEE